jgi:cytosine/adenosine deaminase-related metal-dependent hydrolase
MLPQGGTILTHDSEDHAKAILADVLIEGDSITKIENGIQAPPGAEVIDYTDKILSPGFIDTHSHLWQTLLKGRHGDDLLLDYFPRGRKGFANYYCSANF